MITWYKHDALNLKIVENTRRLINSSKDNTPLKKVVLNKRLNKDIWWLSNCISYRKYRGYSQFFKYSPKRKEFNEDQMYRRIALAVINNNCKRKHGLKINDGKKKATFPKTTTLWVQNTFYWMFVIQSTNLIGFNKGNFEWLFIWIDLGYNATCVNAEIQSFISY